ncbi:MAG TPA: TraI/MobA(P) family conjugative relaxase [Candidatus Paceibacterota bacterium]
MIAKKIPNPKKSATKSGRIMGLGKYIAEPQKKGGMEKCIHFEACNFLTYDFGAQLAEMVALASESRSADPVDHWVLSWQEKEQPTVAQAREAVEIFIAHCGLRGHQFMWGLHRDTDNLHVHIQVNRVNPDTLKTMKINKGFDREAAQQVCALVEYMHGWEPEKGSRYQMVNGKPVLRADSDRRKPLKPTAAARAMELQTGTKSAQRIGIEEAAPIISAARTWRELHDNLIAAGMRYERKGSGAIIFVGDVAVKASDVLRGASLSALQKRLGEYQRSNEVHVDEYVHHASQPAPAAPGEVPRHDFRSLSESGLAVPLQTQQAQHADVLHVDARANRHETAKLRRDGGRRVEPLSANQPGWREYLSIRDKLMSSKSLATAEQQVRHQGERDALFDTQRAERSELSIQSWRGRGKARNAMLSQMAVRHSAERLELREKQQAEHKALREQYPPLSPWKKWNENPRIVAQVAQVQIHMQPIYQPQLSILLRSLWQSNGPAGDFTYHSGDIALFRDEGRALAVLDQSPQSIAAALVVAQSKFGQTLTLTGSPEFKESAVRAAVQYGLSVKFCDPALESRRIQLLEGQREAKREAQRAKREAQQKMCEASLTDQSALQAQPVSVAAQPENETHANPASPAEQLTDVTAAQEVVLAEWRPAREATKGDLEAGKVVAVVDGLAILHVGRGIHVHVPIQPGARPEVGRHLYKSETAIGKGR